MKKVFLIFLYLSALTALSQEDNILKLIRGTGIDKYSDITYKSKSTHPELDDVTNYFFDLRDCKCFEGSPFMVGLKNKKTKNLIVNLQGGGACWSGFFECKEDVTIEEFESIEDDLKNTNEKALWSTIFIPYCDGSNYLGDNVVDYDQDGKIDHWHWGIRHLSAGFNLVQSELDNLEKIFITGCSAGGYGTFSAMLMARLKFPNARIYVLNESGPGISDGNKNGIWDLVRENWGMEEWFPSQVDKSKCSLLPLYSWILEHDLLIKIAMFSSFQDAVLADEFLDISGRLFKKRLLKDTEIIHQQFPDRFKRFFIKGDSHCVEDYLYEIGGMNYSDWVGFFVNDKAEWNDIIE